jgi:hypothetical protein
MFPVEHQKSVGKVAEDKNNEYLRNIKQAIVFS